MCVLSTTRNCVSYYFAPDLIPNPKRVYIKLVYTIIHYLPILSNQIYVNLFERYVNLKKPFSGTRADFKRKTKIT